MRCKIAVKHSYFAFLNRMYNYKVEYGHHEYLKTVSGFK